MIGYSKEYAKKVFTAETMKEAYMKAVKWVATNVLSKDELCKSLVQYEKDKQSPTVTVHLFTIISEQELKAQHCARCREMHSSFFINEATNCNVCSAAGFQNRLELDMKVKATYYRETLKKSLSEE